MIPEWEYVRAKLNTYWGDEDVLDQVETKAKVELMELYQTK